MRRAGGRGRGAAADGAGADVTRELIRPDQQRAVLVDNVHVAEGRGCIDAGVVARAHREADVQGLRQWIGEGTRGRIHVGDTTIQREARRIGIADPRDLEIARAGAGHVDSAGGGVADRNAVGAPIGAVADHHAAAVQEVGAGGGEIRCEQQADARLVARQAGEIDAIETRGEGEVTRDAGVDEAEHLRRALELAASRDVDRVAILVGAGGAVGEDGRIHREIVDVDAAPHRRLGRQRDVVAAAGDRAVGEAGRAGHGLERQRVADLDRAVIAQIATAHRVLAVDGVAERRAGRR